jgi:outer membrane biosynthesis protein TonB
MIKSNDNFLIALSCSIAIHLLVAYVFIFGLPFFFTPLPMEEVITFEMLPVSAISNVPNKKIQKESETNIEEAKKVEKSKADEKPIEKPKEPEPEKPKEEAKKPDAEIVEKKKEEPKKLEKPKEEPKKPDAEMVEKKKEEPKKPEKPKEEPKKPEPKKEVKKKQITNNELDSLLKNLEKESEGTKDKSNKKATDTGEANDKLSKGPYNEDLPLSISDRALVVNQVAKHWDIPIGSENIDKVRVILYILLDKDGSVLEVSIKEKICGEASNTSCHLVAESAVRAVKQASPIQGLPIERYDSWKEFNFLFDPSKMVR